MQPHIIKNLLCITIYVFQLYSLVFRNALNYQYNRPLDINDSFVYANVKTLINDKYQTSG